MDMPDLADPDLYLGGVPHALFRRLRAEDPVHWNPPGQYPGFWAVTRHADIVEVSRQPGLFSSATANGGHRIFDEEDAGVAGMRRNAGKTTMPRIIGARARRCKPSEGAA